MGAVASLLGVVAVGCSADTGWDEASAGNGEIGSVEQAINRTGAKDSLPASQLRDFASSCAVTVSVSGTPTEVMLLAGGISDLSTPTVSNDAFVFNPAGSPQWTRITGAFNTARAHAKMIKVPGVANQCLLIGGEDISGNAVASVRRLTVTHSAGSFAVADANESTGFTGRSKLQVAQCGSNTIIAVGGETSATTPTNTIQRWTAANNAWDTVGSMASTRMEFALAKASASKRFIAAGGFDVGGTETSSIEALVFSDPSGVECDGVSANVLTNGPQLRLSDERMGAVAFESTFNAGTNVSTFVVAGGQNDAATVLSSSDLFTIDWDTAPAATRAAGPALVSSGPIRLPTLVFDSSNEPHLIGGLSGSGANSVVATLQDFANPNFVATTANNLATARVGAVAEFVQGGLFVVGGHDSNGDLLGSTEELVD